MNPEAARPPHTISKVAVEPFECIRAAWSLIVSDGRLGPALGLVGLLLVAMIVPYGSIVLLGPAMCGFYYVVFKWIREEEAGPTQIFKGFEWMWESFAATLLTVFLAAAVTMPLLAIVVFFGWMMLWPSIQAGGQPPIGLTAVIVVGGYGMVVFFSMLVRILLAFTYPLITDRGLQPLDAIKWSFRGASKHIPGLFALAVLNMLISSVGLLFCILPGLMYVPIAIASMAFAHVKIFGLADEPSYRVFEEADEGTRRAPKGAKRSEWQSLDSANPAAVEAPLPAPPAPPSAPAPEVAPASAFEPEPAPDAPAEADEGSDPRALDAETVPPEPPPSVPSEDTVPPATPEADSVASMRDEAEREIDRTVHPAGEPSPPVPAPDVAPLAAAAEVEIDQAVQARVPTPEFGVAETRLMDANPFIADRDEDDTVE